MLSKRKQATPPESPAPSKRPATRSRSPIPVGANGQPLEVVPGKGEQISKLPAVTKQKIGQAHVSVSSAVQAEQAVNNPDDTSRSSAVQLENISHGQLVPPPDTTGGGDPDATTVAPGNPSKPLTAEQSRQLKQQAHIVPTHAGWFSWTSVHPLEKRGLPEFFDGKNKVKTPELYMEYRNYVIYKYRESPDKILTAAGIQDQVADPAAVRRIIEFLDHWGLINYHAPARSGYPAWQGVPPKIEENNLGELQAVSHSGTPSSNLYQFDNVHTSTKTSASSTADPVTALAETVVSETASPPGAGVEYHCNACSADCSKRRYHCQKQADFDLCPDCYNDGKFGPGMATADFIRMDALSDANSDGGGWTDQETLLLLEGLELYGDNWNEIAEHVATKSKSECILHFVKMPIEDPFLEDVEASGSLTAATLNSNQAENEVGAAKKAAKPLEQIGAENPAAKAIIEASADGLSGQDGLIAFSDAGNPVMAQVAFLAAMVGPRVAAAAAQSALMALSEEDAASQVAAKATFMLEGPSCVPLPPKLDRLDSTKKDDDGEARKGNADVNLMEDGHGATENSKEENKIETAQSKPEAALPRGKPPSAERIRNAAATALAAAAVKAKLLAEQEEREMQRLVASVVENQLKKLESKLKQFGELEVMLKKEYEQIERARQRHFAERARLLASRIAPANPVGGVTPPPPGAAAAGQSAPAPAVEQAAAASGVAAAAVPSAGVGPTLQGSVLAPPFNRPVLAGALGTTGLMVPPGTTALLPQQMQMRAPSQAALFNFGSTPTRPGLLGPFTS